MTELEAIEQRIAQLSDEDRRELLERLRRVAESDARRQPFFRLRGAIKTGPGDVTEDVRIARENRGRIE